VVPLGYGRTVPAGADGVDRRGLLASPPWRAGPLAHVAHVAVVRQPGVPVRLPASLPGRFRGTRHRAGRSLLRHRRGSRPVAHAPPVRGVRRAADMSHARMPGDGSGPNGQPAVAAPAAQLGRTGRAGLVDIGRTQVNVGWVPIVDLEWGCGAVRRGRPFRAVELLRSRRAWRRSRWRRGGRSPALCSRLAGSRRLLAARRPR
jgi:hypothetical protein